MCISAGASFGASAVLLVAGAVTMKINKTNIINCIEKIKPLNVFFYYPNTSLLSQYGI